MWKTRDGCKCLWSSVSVTVSTNWAKTHTGSKLLVKRTAWEEAHILVWESPRSPRRIQKLAAAAAQVMWKPQQNQRRCPTLHAIQESSQELTFGPEFPKHVFFLSQAAKSHWHWIQRKGKNSQTEDSFHGYGDSIRIPKGRQVSWLWRLYQNSQLKTGFTALATTSLLFNTRPWSHKWKPLQGLHLSNDGIRTDHHGWSPQSFIRAFSSNVWFWIWRLISGSESKTYLH